MVRVPNLILAISGLGAALTLVAAQPPSALSQVQPGLWEIVGAPGTKAPIRECIGSIATLARFEHRSKNCSAKILKDGGNATLVDYNCGGAGFGRSDIEVLTPRSLRIETQGISNGLPFNYVLQARRVDDCQKNVAVTRH